MAVIFDFCLHLENVSLLLQMRLVMACLFVLYYIVAFNPNGELLLMPLLCIRVCYRVGNECENYTH